MKTRKRVLSLVLVLLLCTALAAPASAEGKSEADIHWFDVEMPDDWIVGDASYVKELGILSYMLYDENYDIAYVNIDLATGKQTDRYGDCFIEPFSCGRALFTVGGDSDSDLKYGYLDTTGKIAIEPVYSDAYPFFEGYAVVDDGHGDAYIDVNGTIMFTVDQFSQSYRSYRAYFRDGIAVAGGCAVIDDHFKYIVEPGVYENIDVFYDGMAVVTDQNSKEGLINTKGEIVLPCAYDRVDYKGAAELICVGNYDENRDLKFGYVDLTGKVVIPIKYDHADPFSEGLAHVETFQDGDWRNTVCEFIDKTGKTVLPIKEKGYDSWSTVFQNGVLDVARYDENETPWFTLIDPSGKEIFPWVKGDTAYLYDNGMVGAADMYDNTWGALYDANGNKIISTDDYAYIVTLTEENRERIRTPEIISIADGKFGWLQVSGDTPTEPQPTEPQPTEPQPTEPQPTEPQPTEPQPTEPQPTEPQPTEPQPTEPQPTEPQPTEPQPTEPQPTEPQPTEPQPTEPQPTEPQPTEPQPTKPRPTKPQPTEPEPTTPADPEPEDVLAVPKGAEKYTLPVEAKVGDGRELEIKVQGGGRAAVEVPVKDAGPGTVVVVVREDGAEEVVRDCVLTEDGLLFDVEGSVTVKLEDRAGVFADMAGEQSWARDAVAYVSARGLFNGTGTGIFAPDENTTRGMTATVLFRLMYEPESAAATFSDVLSGQYYADAVAWAQANSFVNGYEDGSFRPDNTITREELAAILYRFAAYRGLDMTVTESLDGYKDSGLVSDFAKEAMAWCVSNGIINGVDAGVLDPAAFTTRVQLAVVLMRMCQLAAK